MAINLETTRRIVLFEIDRRDPHDLARFHRNISQSIADQTISADDFEEVIGSYEGKMNVAYCMSQDAFDRIFGRIEWHMSQDAFDRVFGRIERYMRGQTEVYQYDLDAMVLTALSYVPATDHWAKSSHVWCTGHAVGVELPSGAPGWTFFPSSGLYFTLLAGDM